MFGLTRSLLDWTDKKYKEAMDSTDEREAMQKASISGFVEGLVDGAVLAYPFLMVACFVYQHKLKNK